MLMQADVNEKEFLKQLMIHYSYEQFAQVVLEAVRQADEPQELAKTITFKMRNV